MTRPNFLLIGAARSGTTSLFNYLGAHPQVCMCPIKEPNFFALEGRRELGAAELGFPWPGDAAWAETLTCRAETIDDYEGLFASCRREPAVGEASPLYLYSPRAPERIAHYLPRARMVAILRQPVERAYSSLRKQRVAGAADPTRLKDLLQAEEASTRSGVGGPLHHLRHGYYARQLRRYFQHFERERIQVHLYDDFTLDPRRVLKQIFGFLDIDQDVVVDTTTRYNVAGEARSTVVDGLFRRPRRSKSALRRVLPAMMVGRLQRAQQRLLDRNVQPAEALSADVRGELTERFYAKELTELEELLGIDLSRWR